MWESFVQHKSIDAIMHDKGLAKIGDNVVNLCYSLAKSQVLGKMTGEKVRDRVLAKAIRATPIYRFMHKRTDAGKAGDAYEAIMAYLWMSDKVTIEDIVASLSKMLTIDSTTNRKKEGEIAAESFRCLLEQYIAYLPQESD